MSSNTCQDGTPSLNTIYWSWGYFSHYGALSITIRYGFCARVGVFPLLVRVRLCLAKLPLFKLNSSPCCGPKNINHSSALLNYLLFCFHKIKYQRSLHSCWFMGLLHFISINYPCCLSLTIHNWINSCLI